jgi:O-antigen/teichoic acid export membrane protein
MKILFHLYKKHFETICNFLWRNLQTLAKGLTVLAIYLIAAKILSPEDFGRLNHIIAVLSLFVIFCDFGISASIGKYVAQARATDPVKLRFVLASITFVVIFVALIVSLPVVLAGRKVYSLSYPVLFMSVGYLFTVPLSSILDGYYRGLKKFRELFLIFLSAGIIAVPASVFFIDKWGFNGALLSLNLFYVILVLFMFSAQKGASPGFDPAAVKIIYRYALLVGMANIAFFMYTKADILILRQFGYLTEIGYYGLIEKLFAIIYLPAAILGQAVGPNISGYMALGRIPEVKRKAMLSSLAVIPASLAASGLIFAVLPFLIKIFLPAYDTPVFNKIITILILLLPFKMYGAFFVNGFITPGGFVRITMIWTFIGGLLNVALDYILIMNIGFIGVFWTTLFVHSFVIACQTVVFFIVLSRLTPGEKTLGAAV